MTPDRPIYITDLTLEPPRPHEDWRFDPERDIPQRAWQRFQRILLEDKRTILLQEEGVPIVSNETGFIMGLRSVMILAPQMFNQFVQDQQSCEVLLRRQKKTITDGYKDGILIWTAAMKVALAKTREELGIDQPMLRQIINLCKNEKNLPNFTQTISLAVVIEPEILPELDLGESDWNIVEEEISEARLFSNHTFAEIAAWAKILFPEKVVGLLNQNDWRILKQLLKDFEQQKSWRSFFYLAATLAILAARKVRVTERGLELVMPERATPFVPPTPPMPTVKKF